VLRPRERKASSGAEETLTDSTIIILDQKQANILDKEPVGNSLGPSFQYHVLEFDVYLRDLSYLFSMVLLEKIICSIKNPSKYDKIKFLYSNISGFVVQYSLCQSYSPLQLWYKSSHLDNM
jgi:hypothetical protein